MIADKPREMMHCLARCIRCGVRSKPILLEGVCGIVGIGGSV